jgi:putative ABC transport system permease protein
MKFIEFFNMAVKSLLSNKLRSALTMLGMIIGVSSVIILMSVGAGLQNYITSTFASLGTNLLFISPANPDAPGLASISSGLAPASLTLPNLDAITKLRSVTAGIPVNENFVKTIAGNKDFVAVLDASNSEYQSLYGFTLKSGQFISEANVARRDMVVVLGSNVESHLFGTTNSLGRQVKIKDKYFTVIGVMNPRGMSTFGFSWDDLMIMPITTFQARLFPAKTSDGEDAVQQMVVRVSPDWTQAEATAEIETLLRKLHHIKPGNNNDFSIMSPEQLLSTFSTITLALTVFLGLIGSISLLVGGIGIMNIMLVSVTERTREIGLRKAIGAKRRDILMQFLFEAGMLSLAGGAIGLIFAWLVTFGISRVNIGGFTISAVISPLILIVAVLVSVFIGLASGIYPAMRASRLNPIDALHYG